MSARAILTPRVNSHPFQERTVTLEQPLKIGRSVARSRPASNNAIFDCKVLSRNHALLWYDAGKFYLQDTKSSNGTFVNNVRLSKSSEESPPTPISSGDILQFGVDVMEVTKKVTHGCIVASLQLFTPDGKEAKTLQVTDKSPPTTLQDIYALHQYLRDAAEREEKLETKLAEMKNVLSNTSEEVHSGWKILIEEDRLLARIDILERQLQACHKSMSEDKLREEVVQLNADKENYQEAAKEALRKSLTDKIEVIKKCQDLERTLSTKEEDHKLLTERSNRVSIELEELAAKFEDSERKCETIAEEMQEASVKFKDEIESLNEKLKMEQKVVLEKQWLIESLMAVEDKNADPSQTLPSTTTPNHNEDLAEVASHSDYLAPTDSFPPDVEPHQLSAPEINTELTILRERVRIIEDEKKDIIARLTYLLNLFEDLKGVSNKTGVSDYLKEMISKVDVELRQVKNFTLGHEEPQHNNYTIETVPQSNFLITQELSQEKQNEELGHRDQLTKDDNSLKKLLEESREAVSNLKKENLNLMAEVQASKTRVQIIQQESEKLRDVSSKAEQQTEELSDSLNKNKELTEQLSTLNDKASAAQARLESLEVEVLSGKKTLKSQAEALDEAQTENSYLHRVIEEQTLRVVDLEKEIRDYKIPQNGFSPSFGSPNQSSTTDSELHSKMEELEEELATFKDRYASSAEECSRLSRKLDGSDGGEGGPFYMQRGFLLFSFISLILAILIAFSPR